MNIGAVSQSVGACASVRWKVGESQGKRGGQVGGTRLGRNSGCTKRKLHLHGCLPTPGPCFWSGRGASIDFGANFDYNTTPPIAHRPQPSAHPESSNIDEHSTNTAGSKRWLAVAPTEPWSSCPQALIALITWSGRRDMKAKPAKGI